MLYGPRVGDQHHEILQELLDQRDELRKKEEKLNEKIEAHI
jgi:uncharacterized coiled-coil DUF342 family protein